MLIGGIFAFIFGTVILVMEAFQEEWIGVNQSETVLVPVAFISGLFLVIGFAFSMAGAYASFRLIRFEVTMTGPAMLIIGFIIVSIYEPFVMFLLSETIVMAIVSLVLLIHARPVFIRVAIPTTNPETNG
jgi:hypothetical protein